MDIKIKNINSIKKSISYFSNTLKEVEKRRQRNIELDSDPFEMDMDEDYGEESLI